MTIQEVSIISGKTYRDVQYAMRKIGMVKEKGNRGNRYNLSEKEVKQILDSLKIDKRYIRLKVLTPSELQFITDRKNKLTDQQIADKLNIEYSTVYKIRKGKRSTYTEMVELPSL